MIYTVTFNPSLDYIVSVEDFKLGLTNRTSSELMLPGGKGINVSLPSLRIDAFSLDVMSKVQDVKKSSLTFAPEAGSQRMRDVINKGLTKDVILKGAWEAFQGGWKRVKLYFMLGLPGETDEDIAAIAELANDIAATYFELPKEERQGRPCLLYTSPSPRDCS